jgi:ABC-type antimicrobial peptide transport system permease subunit
VALGATSGTVLAMILRQGLRSILLGVVIGAAGALAATRALESMLFGVKAGDPTTIASAAAVLVGAGVLAAYIPARRAAKTDPIAALRCD